MRHTPPPQPGFNRREFLAATAASAGALATGPAAARPTDRPTVASVPAKNVIFLVSDGMSTGTLTLADLMLRRRDGRGSRWVESWRTPNVRRAQAFTASADSPVTDSAAGGSAWGCGRHVKNEVLNITPEGREITPILVHAKQNGKATGVVTTTRITHATPASFYANHPKRDLEHDLAPQLLERGIDLAFGGGEKFFPPALLDKHPRTLVARTAAELDALGTRTPGTGTALGLFHDDHVPYELDRAGSVPTLAAMSRVALSILARHGDGFVLQIEGGRVDHAAHHNDAGSLLAEQIAFDDAVGVALDFAQARDDTLVILTSDHGNANPGLTFYGQGALDRFDRVRRVKHSMEWIFENLKPTSSESVRQQFKDLTMQATGVELAGVELEMLAAAAQKKRVAPFAEANAPVHVLGAILADSLGVAFLSPNHTADMVEVTALGPGSEGLAPVIDNVDLWSLMVNAMRLEPAKPG